MKAHKAYYDLPCCDEDCQEIGSFRVWRPNGQRLAGEWCEKHADALVDNLNGGDTDDQAR